MQIVGMFETIFAGCFLIGFLIVIALCKKKGISSFVVATIVGILSPFIFFMVIGTYNMTRDAIEERNYSRIDENELSYFKKVIAGTIEKNEFIKHYKNNKLSFSSLNKIEKFIDNNTIIDEIQLDLIYSIIEAIDNYPEIISILIFNKNIDDKYRSDTLNRLLDKIDNKSHFQFLSFLSQNKQTPQEILTTIAIRGRYDYTKMVNENINAPITAKIIYIIRRQYIMEDRQREKEPLPDNYKNQDYKIAWDRFAADAHEDSRLMVAKHPSVPSEVLDLLANDKSSDVLCWVLLNKNITDITKRKISSFTAMSNNDYLYTHASQNNEDYRKRMAIANNININKKVLETLATDRYDDVRKTVAAREDLSSELFLQLAKDPRYNVRAEIARNPTVPAEIIELLSGDRDWNVLLNLAKNPVTPMKTLKKLREITPARVEAYHINDIMVALDSRMSTRQSQ